MKTEKFFNYLGLLGVLLLVITIIVNKLSPQDFFLREHYLKLLLVSLVVTFVHYCYLGMRSVQQKQWWWAGLLLLAPIPVYWLYFAWELVKGYCTFLPFLKTEPHQ
ncbi:MULTISPECIES: hypothetical protein [Motilimonas]|uniref:Uncharacterized protein n=1 Tax=Motilimonas cestriensis TaxID=2742685 RepID=A0ABS8WFK4_9GAMM|nr:MULTISPECIES: hypothetical protein [Motilimonas]MCE2596463.1 hypothetical protein [Motilimonas cestriensis]MDO6526745.1 hypothetical protein [Motilimonas sp. 1_MG-2023]